MIGRGPHRLLAALRELSAGGSAGAP